LKTASRFRKTTVIFRSRLGLWGAPFAILIPINKDYHGRAHLQSYFKRLSCHRCSDIKDTVAWFFFHDHTNTVYHLMVVGRFVYLIVPWVETIRIPRASEGANVCVDRYHFSILTNLEIIDSNKVARICLRFVPIRLVKQLNS